jgi:hypothetical protein
MKAVASSSRKVSSPTAALPSQAHRINKAAKVGQIEEKDIKNKKKNLNAKIYHLKISNVLELIHFIWIPNFHFDCIIVPW